MLQKPTTNTSAACIRQDSHAQEHTRNSPSPHPAPASVETHAIVPSSTCSVLGFKVLQTALFCMLLPSCQHITASSEAGWQQAERQRGPWPMEGHFW